MDVGATGLLLGVVLVAIGCGEKDGGSGDGTDSEAGAVDLFACELQSECQASAHFFGSGPPIPEACVAELVQAEEPGLVLVYPHFVPKCADWSRLVLVRGDGTVVIQTRENFATGADCEGYPGDWKLGPQYSCELDIPDDFAELEKWFPEVKNCVEGEFYTCETASALVGE